MKESCIMLLIMMLLACNDNRNTKCNLAEIQNNFEAHTVCVDYSDNLNIEYQITTRINKVPDRTGYNEIVGKNSIVLEYANDFTSTNVTDVTGGIELTLIINKEEHLLDGQIKTIPSESIRGVGILRGARGAWAYSRFDTIRGRFKILEITPSSIQIEIIDSLYATKKGGKQNLGAEGELGLNYVIDGVIRFND